MWKHQKEASSIFEFIAKFWIEFLFGIVISVVGFGFKRINRKLKEQDSVKMGVQALLRDRIIQSYNKCIEQGFCQIYVLENVNAMYNQYHALGGNGTITKLVEDLQEMPTRQRDAAPVSALREDC